MGAFEGEIIDAAKYLRSIRPIDPDELIEYTTHAVSPSNVRSILRSHALELDLIEQPDGTFIPVSTDPITGSIEELDHLPPALETFVEVRLETRRGRSWEQDTTGELLREALRHLKSDYLEGGSIVYGDHEADAYLLYHLPRSYGATTYTIGELIEAGLLDHSLRILDIGAGVGAHLAAIDDLTPSDALIDYQAIEPSPLNDHLSAIAAQYTGLNTHVTIETDPIEDTSLAGPYDLILFGNVLSELSDPKAVVPDVIDHLAPDGSWVGIAPADPRTSIQLRAIERTIEPEVTVFSPTLRLWPSRRPTDECWSFVQWPSLSVPTFQRRLSESAPEDEAAYRNVDVRYSYSIMRPDGRRRYDITASTSTARPLGDVGEAIGERIDAMMVKLSGNLAEGGNPIYRVGDGSQSDPCFCSHVASTELNERLALAPYGAILKIEQGLVLWNDDEEAINLVVDDATFVDQLAP